MRKRTIITVLSLWTVGAICSMAHPAEAQARHRHPLLDSLGGFYEKAESVHLRAVLDVSVRLPLYEGHAVPVAGHGVIEHWEQDGKFRTKFWIDPRLGLADNVEISYNGVEYQLYWLDTGALAIEDPQFMTDGLMMVPGAVPNPLYLPMAHLAPSDDDCPSCQPTLGFLKNAEHWTDKVSGLKPIELADPVFHLPGGSRAGEAYTFQVGIRAAESFEVGKESRLDIHRIDRLRTDGKIISSIFLSGLADVPAKNYAGENRLRFPKTIRLDGYDPDQPEGQHLVTRVDYAIELLEVGADFEDDVFEIQQESAVAVWQKGLLVRQR